MEELMIRSRVKDEDTVIRSGVSRAGSRSKGRGLRTLGEIKLN